MQNLGPNVEPNLGRFPRVPYGGWRDADRLCEFRTCSRPYGVVCKALWRTDIDSFRFFLGVMSGSMWSLGWPRVKSRIQAGRFGAAAGGVFGVADL